MTKWFKVAEVAAHLRMSPDDVRREIRARRLGHMVRNPAAKRPTYLISDRHIAAYERERDRPAA